MLDSVRRTIENFGLLKRGDKVIVAVSGGPDSIALLLILMEMTGVYDLTLLVAHLNHGLRGTESDRDETFVREFSSVLGLPFVSKRVDISRVMKEGRKTMEEAGREERYRFMEEVRKKERFDKVALGHHLDDQVETVVMRFLRGSGLRGLKGMVPLRGDSYIRPLLGVTRREIIAYLRSRGTTYVEDSSNESEACLRNRIRRHLIPGLVEGYNPRLVQNIGRSASILRVEDDYMQGVVENILTGWAREGAGDGVTLSITKVKDLHEALQRRLIMTLLLRTACSGVGIGFRHVEAVMALLHGAEPAARLHLPFGLYVEREYDTLHVKRRVTVMGKDEERAPSSGPSYHYNVIIPGVLDIPEAGRRMAFTEAEKLQVTFGSPRTVFMDRNAVAGSLTVRNWMPGDRIDPFGWTGTKKIKEIFIDKKIPRKMRGMIPVVADERSILWVAGVVQSNRVKIDDRTKRVLKIEID